MPNIKSAKKRVKVIKAKTLHNKILTSSLRTTIKKAEVSLDNNAPDKEAAIKAAVKKIDQAVTKGILHKNNAARKKSALMTKLNKSGA